jgi:creatinine amidohydrolase
MDRARAEYPQFPPAYGAVPIPLHEISKSGVFGDPRGATAEKGTRILDAITDRAWTIVESFLAGLKAPGDA